MKTKKNKSSKKVNGKSKTEKVSPDDDMALMKKKYEEMKRRAEGGGGGGENADAMWDVLTLGKNMRRILPRGDGIPFFIDVRTHWRVGPEQRSTIRCIAGGEHFNEKGMPIQGTPCPLCKKFLKEQARCNTAYKRGDEEGRAEWRKAKEAYCPRVRSLMNVLTSEGEVKVLGAGPMIMKDLFEHFYETDGETMSIGNFTDPENGRWMNIKRTGKGAGDRLTKYTVRPAAETDDISDQWEEIEKLFHDLEKAAGPKLTAEQITAIMKGETVEDDEEEESTKSDDDDDDDDDDDE